MVKQTNPMADGYVNMRTMGISRVGNARFSRAGVRVPYTVYYKAVETEDWIRIGVFHATSPLRAIHAFTYEAKQALQLHAIKAVIE